ncbi:MAG: pyridoxal phosphate-dependent aminotransferase [Gaiellaceae bacterium]
MSALLEAVEGRITGIDAYRPGRATFGELPDQPGKLSSNENVYGPAPAAAKAVAALTGTRVARYPDGAPFRSALAAQVGVGPESLVLTNGSDELCALVAQLVVEPGDAVVVGDPCYRVDEIVSLAARARLERVPLWEGVHDLDAMAAAARAAKLVWLPNPHNPTGTTVDPAVLATFLERVPSETLIVLDEAYRDYADEERHPDALALLARHANLLLQRTLSKAAGLAGLRVGYAIAHPRLIAALDAVRAPFNVNQAALAAAEASLAEEPYRRYTIGLIRRERARLEAELSVLGVSFFASQANFVTVASGAGTEALHGELAGQGIVVRDGSDLGFPGHVRITVGAPAQMLLVRRALRRVFGDGAGGGR